MTVRRPAPPRHHMVRGLRDGTDLEYEMQLAHEPGMAPEGYGC